MKNNHTKQYTMKKILLLLVAYASITQVRAQDANSSFSLKQAIEFAMNNQPNVKNALLDEAIAKKKVDEITGIGTPQINASADINKFIEIPTSFVPAEFFGGNPGEFFGVQFGQPYTANAGVTATQLLFDGSYLVGLQASKTYMELSRKATVQTKTETAVNVSKAYYGALVADARLLIIDANIQRVTKLFSDTKALNDNGLVEKIDVDRLELSLNNLKVEKEKVERFKLLSYALLKFQMGYDNAKALTLTDKLDESILAVTALPDSADYTKRPEYGLINVQRQLQALDLKRIKAGYLPSLVAFGNASTNASRNDFNIFNTDYRWFPSVIAGLKLNVPIWDGLQRKSQIAQSKLTLQKVDNSMALMKNGFALDYENAKTSYQNNLASLKIVKKNQTLANEISRVSKIKYESGVGSSLELIDAESSVKEADANYLNTLYETIISKIDLDKSTGTITF
jgi:outer membrane protein TolC